MRKVKNHSSLRKYVILLGLFLFQFGMGQVVNIENIHTTGRFASCSNSKPTVTAELINSTGSSIVNGELVITDPCGFTTLEVYVSGVQWSQSPGANWIHGYHLPENSGIIITAPDEWLPEGWATFDGSIGACNGKVGGQGIYFDDSASNSNCMHPTLNKRCGENIVKNDGKPWNNYGDQQIDCGTNAGFTVKFEMTFCNSQVETTTLDFQLIGDSDGNTGCWTTLDDDEQEPNTVNFSINTVESQIPLYDVPAQNTQVFTHCENNNEFNYIAELVAGCGTGQDVTWWDTADGGNMIGVGSPFLYDTPGSQCPEGLEVYASCCPTGEGCEREKVVIGACLPPSATPTFAPIPPQCPDLPSPLPPVSLEGATGSWSPVFDPQNTTTYTFTPDPNQCVTQPTTLEVVILPPIFPEFANLQLEYCQGETVPNLPGTSDNGYTGTWSPSHQIDTSVPGTFTYTFEANEDCAELVSIDIVIKERIVPNFNLPLEYCQGETVPILPGTSDDGHAGAWFPTNQIDTSQPGLYTYTFSPTGLDCFDDFTMDILIKEEIIPTFPVVDAICQNTIAPALPAPNENLTGTWTPATIDTSLPGVFDFTFEPDYECSESVTIQIEILPETVFDFNLKTTYCQFEIPEDLPTLSNNGVEGNWTPNVIDTSVVGTKEYTFWPINELCPVPYVLTIEVFPTPVLNPVPNQFLCDQDFDGLYVVNFNDYIPILGAGLDYQFYASQADLDNGISIPTNQWDAYAFNSLPQEIFVVGTNASGCSSINGDKIIFELETQVQHDAGPFGPIEYCPDDKIDLTQYETQISSEAGVDFTYYNTFQNAANQLNPIADADNFQPGNSQTTAYVRVDLGGFCSAIVEIELFRFTTPSLTVSDSAYLCPGDSYEVSASSDDPTVTFIWTLEDGTEWTGPNQTIDTIGVYTIVAISGDGCPSEVKTITVQHPPTPTILEVNTSGNSITVVATNNGYGELDYSLDQIFWQSSHRFENLIPGETYTIWVRGSGCMLTSYEITLLKIVNFFSPNNDGKNDTWMINGITSNVGATIKIFDRNGKIFVDRVFVGDYLWDGKYMGRTVPSGDYWYIITIPGDGIVAERKISGHVTVKTE